MAKASLRGRRLARAIIKIREDAQLMVSEAAELAGFSQSKLTRIENLKIGIKAEDVATFCDALEVPSDVKSALIRLAGRAKGRRDWWVPYAKVLGDGIGWMELEADAVRAYSFTNDVVPGLLQTEAYCTAMIRMINTRNSGEDIEKRVAARMKRQERLKDSSLQLWSIIDEPALRRPMGGHDVMAEQIDHIIEMARLPHVSIQALTASTHSAIGVPFHMFLLDDGLGVVALDDLFGGTFLDDDGVFAGYMDTWNQLTAAALPFDHSIELLETLSRDHRSTSNESRSTNTERMEEEHAKRK
ncbi:helix-turn-helix transcriptional regulator [Amycolatopsis minnesotensis]|uniref:helix-turn-helix domain-containing protein n=1 Tax=Amycolatopsis minnesotensis TaxID=337894 RepID=UPI0031D969E1